MTSVPSAGPLRPTPSAANGPLNASSANASAGVGVGAVFSLADVLGASEEGAVPPASASPSLPQVSGALAPSSGLVVAMLTVAAAADDAAQPVPADDASPSTSSPTADATSGSAPLIQKGPRRNLPVPPVALPAILVSTVPLADIQADGGAKVLAVGRQVQDGPDAEPVAAPKVQRGTGASDDAPDQPTAAAAPDVSSLVAPAGLSPPPLPPSPLPAIHEPPPAGQEGDVALAPSRSAPLPAPAGAVSLERADAAGPDPVENASSATGANLEPEIPQPAGPITASARPSAPISHDTPVAEIAAALSEMDAPSLPAAPPGPAVRAGATRRVVSNEPAKASEAAPAGDAPASPGTGARAEPAAASTPDRSPPATERTSTEAAEPAKDVEHGISETRPEGASAAPQAPDPVVGRSADSGPAFRPADLAAAPGSGVAGAGHVAPSGRLAPPDLSAQLVAAPAGNAVQPPVPIASVPVEIGLRALDGASHFEIRLTPDDLGRIDVKLDIDTDGRVDASLVVDRPETLAFLQRERGQLERVFEQAGLKPGEAGVNVSLRDGGGDGSAGRSGQGSGEGGGSRPQSYQPADPDDRPAPHLASVPLRRLALAGLSGIDLHI